MASSFYVSRQIDESEEAYVDRINKVAALFNKTLAMCSQRVDVKRLERELDEAMCIYEKSKKELWRMQCEVDPTAQERSCPRCELALGTYYCRRCGVRGCVDCTAKVGEKEFNCSVFCENIFDN